VAAKRYLCTTKPGYLDSLSPASLQSFHLQGGLMNEDEILVFESRQEFDDALRLRGYDDAAKVIGLEVPGIVSYRHMLNSVLSSHPAINDLEPVQ
jgi:[1-hydroxy-2-(trimethylamino)ethyl]phosphonate dioxygenase